jgi:single-stranded-DNA-specific exonuclease
MLTEDYDEAQEYVSQLMSLNEKRKQTETEIFAEIRQYINDNPDILNQRVLVLVGKNWHHGVIGIVSSRVLEAYGKPNIILSVEENGMARGSARSIKGFDIHKCFVHASPFLEKFGGHECAGGLSLLEQNIPDFTKSVLEYAGQFEKMPSLSTECDMTIEPQELTVENIRSLDVLEPHGADNPKPTFYLPACRVNAIYPLSNGKHTKLDITYRSQRLQVLVFSKSPQEMFFGTGAEIDIAAHIEVNEFGGRVSLAVKAADMKPSGFDTEKYLAAKDCYERLKRGERLSDSFMKRIVPSRQELVSVYKLMRNYSEIGVDSLFMKINSPAINYCKLRLMIDIFCEGGLARFSPSEQKVTLVPPKSKVDLQSTKTMKYLNSLR